MTRHLVWDWNGTLLDDLHLAVSATNASLALVSAGPVTADAHRRDFRRPVATYYAHVLGRPVEQTEFIALDKVFHDAYRGGLATCQLAPDALAALAAWTGTQSLLSMWFHHELVPTIESRGLAGHFARVDGLPGTIGGGFKAGHLEAHLLALGLSGADCVLIGDSVDDADAARSVGASCVLYAGGFTDPDRLRETGVPVADSLLDAVALAESVGVRTAA